MESKQPTGSKKNWKVRWLVMMSCLLGLNLLVGLGKYGRLLGWLYIGDDSVSLNEQMIEEGYAHAYDGGTKNMDLEALREIRRAHGTMV